MTRTSTGLVVVVAVLLLTPAAFGTTASSQSEPVREIDNCGVISEPGRYVLTSDITNGGSGDGFTYASQSCIVVESDDVHIQGNGHRVDALGNSDTTGVEVAGTESDPVENVTVSNVTFTDWNRAVYFRHVENGAVRGSALRASAYGMSIEHSEDVRVVDAMVVNNLLGIYENDTTDTELSNIRYASNYAGDHVVENGTDEGDESVETPTATPTATPTPTPTPTEEDY
ncbi:NosD domain-containing protein [Halogeometricum luteum]|uniref:Periplasmic copper-binding protein NosD beta helix domain-containing protein n=1 Tax=Halogeometricum luteum TaxID=2950537 RepID=A0ABU2FWX1_9EURY|nr:NosD domain-containing protein [Halogeometricum sp. S3BR5-2]MDS0293035.1 hypothetical protein [Halogeometricum sp. S3BR5-2]